MIMHQVKINLNDGRNIIVPLVDLKKSHTFTNCCGDALILETEEQMQWKCDYIYPQDIIDFWETFYPVAYHLDEKFKPSFYPTDLFRFFGCAEYLDMPDVLVKLGQDINNMIATVCPVNVPVTVYKVKKSMFPSPMRISDIEVHHQMLLPNNNTIIFKHLIENIVEIFPTMIFTEYLFADIDSTKKQMLAIAHEYESILDRKLKKIESSIREQCVYTESNLVGTTTQTDTYDVLGHCGCPGMCSPPHFQLVNNMNFIRLSDTYENVKRFIDNVENGIHFIPIFINSIPTNTEEINKTLNDFTNILTHSQATPYLSKKLMKRISTDDILSRKFTNKTHHTTANEILGITEEYNTVGEYVELVQNKLLDRKTEHKFLTRILTERIDIVNSCTYLLAVNDNIDINVLREYDSLYNTPPSMAMQCPITQ